jgi:hypothetical protein
MTSTTPRITPDMTPAQKRRAVRGLLRELAGVLRAARKANRNLPWPAAAVRPAEPTMPAAAV